MNSKYYFVIIILLILLLVFNFSCLFCEKKNLENFKNKLNLEDVIGTNKAQHKYGNKIINMQNPGKSIYVIKQSSIKDNKEKTRYGVNIDIKPGMNYKINCWVTYDDNWDGNFNLFSLVINNKNGKPDVFTNKGKLIGRRKVKNFVWELREHLFHISNEVDGPVEIYIGYDPENTLGSRYITDINIREDQSLIESTPAVKNIIMFLSTYQDKSIDLINKKWVDISSNKNNFIIPNNTEIKDGYLNLSNGEIEGPPSDNLIKDNKKFTIVFSGKMNEYTNGKLLEIYSNNSYNTGLRITSRNNVGINNNLIIDLIGKQYRFKVGITQKHSIYVLIINLNNKRNNRLELFKDGYKLKPTTIINIGAWNRKKRKVYYPNEDIDLSNKNMTLSSKRNKRLKMGLDFLLMYNTNITKDNVIDITNYLNSFRINKQFDRPNTMQSVINDNLDNEENNVCPFKNIEDSPCDKKECCGVNWMDMNNLPSVCKVKVNNYCKNPGDKTCSILRSEKQDRINVSCANSKSILSNLRTNLTQIDEKIVENKSSCTSTHNSIKNTSTISSDKKINLNDYIRKDKIPCWGCNLENITK